MIIADGHSCAVRCDGCGAQGEAIDYRTRPELKPGAVTIPISWATDHQEGERFHCCGECQGPEGQPFGDRRAIFEARFAEFGPGFLTEVSIFTGVPPAIGRRWAAEIRQSERNRAA